jgi:hypothetical protein
MDKLAELLEMAIRRWTAESPKAAKITTDIAIGVGIAATVITILPLTYPAWVLPVVAFAIAFSAKFTVK